MGNIIARETGVPSNAHDVRGRTFIGPADEESENAPSRFFHSIRIDATTAIRGSTSGALFRRIKKEPKRGLASDQRPEPMASLDP
jgi:hypothetical protein